MIGYKELIESVKFIESKIKSKPKLGVVLGSGLGKFANELINSVQISFKDIPHFLPPTVEGHEGTLICGDLKTNSGTFPIFVLQGRLHYHEGLTMDQVVVPIRTLCMLGLDTLILTNAAGAVNPSYRESDLMLITDHINLMGDNPLRGPHAKEFGPKFPDLSEGYSLKCNHIVRSIAQKIKVNLREGVYTALSGPTYETPAEIRMLRILGADAVGMSTVPEVIAANHFGVKIIGISCITNLASGITSQKLSHAEVLKNAGIASNQLNQLLINAIPELLN